MFRHRSLQTTNVRIVFNWLFLNDQIDYLLVYGTGNHPHIIVLKT